VYTGLWWGNLKERGCFEDLSIGGRIILEWILKKSFGKIDWTQDTDKWLADVNAVMKSRIPRNAGNFLTNCRNVKFSKRG
jgi:hypothetical protein